MDRYALLLLAVGSVIGVLLGLISVLHGVDLSTVAAPPEDAIALVNGKPIREDEYVNALTLLAGDKRDALTDEDRAHVLTRLIEEELLVQHGVAGGLVDTDRSVRIVMTQALMDSIMAESASELPTEEELQSFYEQHLSLFAPQPPADGATQDTIKRTSAFAHARERVVAMYFQYARDEALRAYLDWLRAEAKIAVFLPAPLAGEGQ
jgi:hypothetical protein